MRVAILGAGAIGFGASIFLLERGHDPILWSPSGKSTAELAAGKPLKSTGMIEGNFTPRVAKSCQEAVSDADVVMVALPANGYRMALDAATPHITAMQAVIFSGHLSFAALYLAKNLASRGIRIPLVCWGTSVTGARRRSMTEVNVTMLRNRVDMATVPVSASDRGLSTCQTLFGDRFEVRPEIMSISISNVNPPSHMALVLPNLTRMERGESWKHHENVTDTGGRLLDGLDAERLAIAKKLGTSARTAREHLAMTFKIPAGPLGEMSRVLVAQGNAQMGPDTIDSRYVLEDMPFGIFPTEQLGKLVGVETRLHTAGLDLLSAMYGRDFRAENDLLHAIGFDKMSLADLQARCTQGF